MGVSEKPSKLHVNNSSWFTEYEGQANTYNSGGASSNNDGKKWVIAGIQLRAPLKPISVTSAPEEKKKSKKKKGDRRQTKAMAMINDDDDDVTSGGSEEYYCSTTPTSAGSRIPATLMCPPPPPPRKRKPAPRCSFRGKDFFNPPDLDTVFIRRHQPC